MRQAVNIKSSSNGISILLDPDIPFEDLYIAYAEKFRDSAKFFGDAKIVITFEGRKLSDLEERALIEAIGEYTNLNVLCVIEQDKDKNQLFIEAANAFAPDGKPKGDCVYKGTLHAGQNLVSDDSVIVVGDVNPGASIKTKGSAVVLGTIYGDVWAGCDGDEGTFVSAMDIQAEAVKVADLTCRVFYKSAGWVRKTVGTKIVYISDDKIECDLISKEFLANLPF